MERSSSFTIHELEAMNNNPVIRPLIEKLIFVAADHIGFYQEGK